MKEEEEEGQRREEEEGWDTWYYFPSFLFYHFGALRRGSWDLHAVP